MKETFRVATFISLAMLTTAAFAAGIGQWQGFIFPYLKPAPGMTPEITRELEDGRMLYWGTTLWTSFKTKRAACKHWQEVIASRLNKREEIIGLPFGWIPYDYTPPRTDGLKMIMCWTMDDNGDQIVSGISPQTPRIDAKDCKRIPETQPARISVVVQGVESAELAHTPFLLIDGGEYIPLGEHISRVLEEPDSYYDFGVRMRCTHDSEWKVNRCGKLVWKENISAKKNVKFQYSVVLPSDNPRGFRVLKRGCFAWDPWY